jgi:hypothetical protein
MRRLRALLARFLYHCQAHDPRVYPAGNQWAVEFVLEGEPTVWCTDKLSDALAFAVNLHRI